jgi:hypothetical protein
LQIRQPHSKKTFDDPAIIGDGEVSVLNLYNKRQDPSALVKQVIKFVQQPFDDFILYYCGHGVIPLGRNAFSVYLRTTETTALNSTALGFRGFLQDLERFLVGKRAFIVIDACYSGEVIREIMDANAAVSRIDQHLVDSLPKAGMAVATASEPSGEARALQEDTMTLYTGNLLETLREGVQSLSNYETLSWQDVNDHVADRVRERLGSQAPIPRLLAIRSKDGDITKAPFFINKAYRRSDTSAAEHAHWEFVAKRSDLVLLEDFLTKFPNGIYKALAVARMTEVVASETRVDVLQRFAKTHPTSIGATQAQSRAAALIEWREIEKLPIEGANRQEIISKKIEALRSFVEKFPEANETGIAHAVMTSLQWSLLRDSTDSAAIEAFMLRNAGEHTAEARRRLEQLRQDAAARKQDQDPEQPKQRLAAVGSSAAGSDTKHRVFGGRIRPVVAWVVGAVALVAFVVWAMSSFRGSGENQEQSRLAERAALDAAGFDLTKLRAYLGSCAASGCTFAKEAQGRLDRIGAERNALDAADSDLVKLRAYLQSCAAPGCIFAKEAQAKLDRLDSERKTLDAAGFDPTKLRAYLQSCLAPGCMFAKEAQDRLDRLDSERKTLDAAGFDPTKLRAYLQGCPAAGCILAKEAQAKLDRYDAENRTATAAGFDPTKLRGYLQSCAAVGCIFGRWAQDRLDRNDGERKTLDAAGFDPTKLRAYLQSCATPQGCLFAKEAQDKFAFAAPQASGNPDFVEYKFYDSPQNDYPYLPNVDLDRCTAECRAKQCSVYTYDRWNNWCYIKKMPSKLILEPKSTTWILKTLRVRPETSSGITKFSEHDAD